MPRFEWKMIALLPGWTVVAPRSRYLRRGIRAHLTPIRYRLRPQALPSWTDPRLSASDVWGAKISVLSATSSRSAWFVGGRPGLRCWYVYFCAPAPDANAVTSPVSQEPMPAPVWKQTSKRSDQGTISRSKLRTLLLASQHRQLVPQHHQFQVLGELGPPTPNE